MFWRKILIGGEPIDFKKNLTNKSNKTCLFNLQDSNLLTCEQSLLGFKIFNRKKNWDRLFACKTKTILMIIFRSILTCPLYKIVCAPTALFNQCLIVKSSILHRSKNRDRRYFGNYWDTIQPKFQSKPCALFVFRNLKPSIGSRIIIRMKTYRSWRMCHVCFRAVANMIPSSLISQTWSYWAYLKGKKKAGKNTSLVGQLFCTSIKIKLQLRRTEAR